MIFSFTRLWSYATKSLYIVRGLFELNYEQIVPKTTMNVKRSDEKISIQAIRHEVSFF